MSDPKSLLTAQQFAEKARISSSTVQKWLRTGKIKGIKQNGKWMIATEQLTATSHKIEPGQTRIAQKSDAPVTRAAGYSVEEFSAMTYLTLSGVERYLKEGRLSGARDAAGYWRIDPESLEMPNIQHLLRRK
jgi:hypothetical protein